MSEHSYETRNRSDKISVNSYAALQRQKSDNNHSSAESAPGSILDSLHNAAGESSQPLDTGISTPLSQQFGYDFSRVRVHSGPASATAADSIGAHAYTLGNRIHLGEEARNLSQQQHNQLLVHEAVHTLQQGGQEIAPSANLNLSNPNDAAEQEAQQIADSFPKQTRSPSLGLRDHLRTTTAVPHTISRIAAPILQRDLKGKHPVTGGEFKMNMKTESHPGAKNGMSGTIKFKASETAPDSTRISLLQVIRDQDLDTGSEYVWTGDEAGRNDVQTTADPATGIEAGFHVDRIPKDLSPRSKATDPEVSPYYIANFGPSADNKDGSKKGKAITEAALWDYPGSSGNRKFTFETIAKATDTNHVYGTVMWGFTISDAAKGTVEKEHAVGRNVTLASSDKAIDIFNEFYKNPGASTAP